MKGEKDAIEKFTESERVAEQHIKHLRQENRLQECLYYAEAVKRYDVYCDILIELNKVLEAIESAKKHFKNPDLVLPLVKKIYDTDIPENKKLTFEFAEFGTTLMNIETQKQEIEKIQKPDLYLRFTYLQREMEINEPKSPIRIITIITDR